MCCDLRYIRICNKNYTLGAKMFKIIRESFKITNSYIVIATPLILFSLFSSIYVMLSSNGSLLSLVITAILFFLMLASFLSGWFFMIKKAVVNSDEEQKNNLIVEFPAGVGEYFLSILGMIFVIVLVFIATTVIVGVAGKKLIGDTGVSYNQLSTAFASVESMKVFLTSLTPEQISKFKAWNLLLMFGMIFNYFVTMFYFPVVFFKEKNPFKAFFINIKDTFGRKIFNNIFLFIFMFIAYFILSILTVLFGGNIVTHFILTLINFYYATFIGVLIFNYYYSNFAKIGSQIDKMV